MSTRTFTVDELEEVGYVNEIKESVDSGRWTEYFQIVFRADDNKLYLVDYEEGLTEYQDLYGEDRFPDSLGGEVPCTEVDIYEEMVPVKKWKRV